MRAGGHSYLNRPLVETAVTTIGKPDKRACFTFKRIDALIVDPAFKMSTAAVGVSNRNQTGECIAVDPAKGIASAEFWEVSSIPELASVEIDNRISRLHQHISIGNIPQFGWAVIIVTLDKKNSGGSVANAVIRVIERCGFDVTPGIFGTS